MEEEKFGEKSGLRQYIVLYLDIVLRSLISFLGIGVVLSIFLVSYLKMKFILVLPIIFILAVLISPFLSKIKLGEFLLDKYENFLNKLFRRTLND